MSLCTSRTLQLVEYNYPNELLPAVHFFGSRKARFGGI